MKSTIEIEWVLHTSDDGHEEREPIVKIVVGSPMNLQETESMFALLSHGFIVNTQEERYCWKCSILGDLTSIQNGLVSNAYYVREDRQSINLKHCEDGWYDSCGHLIIEEF